MSICVLQDQKEQRNTKSVEGTEELPDTLLLERAYEGDQGAFEMLVSRYNGLLYRYIKARLGNEGVDDVLQHVWIQLYKSLPKIQHNQVTRGGSASIKAWLFQVALNRCIDEIRRRARHPQTLFSDLDVSVDEESSILAAILDSRPLPEEQAEYRDEWRHVLAALQHLPMRVQAVVWLRYTEELSFPMIARRLNIPPATAKTYYSRACVKLRAALAS